MECVPLRGRLLQLLLACLLNRFDLVANEVQACQIAAQLADRVRRQWFVFGAAQRRETIARLAQFDVDR
jgi:hypothetical protein